jgi:hypothetical protein
MPLTQPPKDAALAPACATVDALLAWPADVPERGPILDMADNLRDAIAAAVVPPPVPVQPLDPLLVYDVPLNQGSSGSVGSTTADYLYIPTHPWDNKGGDWVDNTELPQGTTPFASVPIKLGQTGAVTLDVSGLLRPNRPGEQMQICLRAKLAGATSPTFVFNSKESVTGGAPALFYGDGSLADLPNADVACNRSTANELGGNQTWIVSALSNVYLRFPAPPAGTTKATLTLSLVHVADAGGFLEAYDGTKRLPAPPTETWSLAGSGLPCFIDTPYFGLDAPPYIRARLYGDPAHSLDLDKYGQRNVVTDETGAQVLQITFDPHLNAGATVSILFPDQNEVTEAASEFDIRFMPDMVDGMTQGFKCAFGWSSATKNDDAYYASIWKLKPGRCGTLLSGNGGAKAHGNDGWSMRFDAFRPVTPDTHPLAGHVVPMQYVYWPEQADFYGDPWPWNLAQYTPKVGEWHTITQRAKVNSMNMVGGFNSDAELDGYLDGHLALRRRGFYLRTTDKPIISLPPYNVDSKLKIGRIWFNVYHGGTALPRSRCSFQIRNFRAAVLTP